MSGNRSTEGTLNLTDCITVMVNRANHTTTEIAKAIEDGERQLRKAFVRRVAIRQPFSTPEEDKLEDLIDDSFEYLCAQMGVREAELLCRSLEH